jgi:peptidoglycan hydrolase CwlO-like protein
MNAAWPDKVIRAVGSTGSLLAHTAVFAGSLVLILAGFEAATVMLVLTTAVSLEAIYLSILIQMALNRQAAALAAVQEDVDEIQEDVEEIGVDVDEIQKDVDEIQEDVEEIGEDVGEIQKDVDEIQKDVDEIQEDVDEIQEEVVEDDSASTEPTPSIDEIEADIARLADRVAALRRAR